MPESQYLIHRRELKLGIKKPDKKVRKPLAKKSHKFKVDDRLYKKIVREMLSEDDRCELKTPVCTQLAEGLHHTKRRGVNLLNRKYLKRACNACNNYCERFPQYALDHGLSVSKFKV